jgi:hypothetical protein
MKGLACCLLLFLVGGIAQPGTTQVPLVNAHAHNDYEHKRPLLDALEHGFCSVEADIWLVDGELLVAHDRDKVKPGRTLQALYLDPLRKRVKEKGGHVYRNDLEFTLLIDVKSDAEKTYAVLREVLKQYAEILTEFHLSYTKPKAVTVIISGARAVQTMLVDKIRYCGVDGRLQDLEEGVNRNLTPLVSDQWFGKFGWLGVGTIPDDVRRKVENIVKQARRDGVRLRFWATPETPNFWRTMRELGVDLIGTDDLDKLQKFLLTTQTN